MPAIITNSTLEFATPLPVWTQTKAEIGCPRMHQLLKCHAPQGSCDAKFPKFLKSIKIWALG